MRVQNYNEIIGTVRSVSNDNELVHVLLGFDIKIDIPVSAICIEKLKKHLGKKVGIFNNNGAYIIKEVKK